MVDEEKRMPNPTGNPGSYTLQDGVALKEHLEVRLDALQAWTETRLTSLEKATETARRTMETRLESMNEFRDALRDTTGRLATREELVLQVDRLTTDISDLKKFKNVTEGKASQQSVNVATILGIISLLIALTSLALKLA